MPESYKKDNIEQQKQPKQQVMAQNNHGTDTKNIPEHIIRSAHQNIMQK